MKQDCTLNTRILSLDKEQLSYQQITDTYVR